MSFGALKDLKIIDLTTRLSGPFGTMLFSDQGAEVIKVEPPKMGDIARLVGPFLPNDEKKNFSGYFHSINRNKKSIVLDLKTPEGKAVLLSLLKDADAIIENFKEGTMEKLGLSYEYLQSINPKLVYGALRGFGDSRTKTSPYAKFPSYDVIAQAMGGLMGVTGPDAETPIKAGPGLGDILPGMLLAFGVLSAIHHAKATGQGQFVDIAMADAVLYASERIVYQHSITNKVPQSTGNMHPFLSPFGLFEAKDGHITIAAPDDSLFEKLCKALGAMEMLEEEKFRNAVNRRAHRVELEQRLNALTKKYTKLELMDRLGGLVPNGPVLKMDEIKSNPHFVAREMIVPVAIPELDAAIDVVGVPIKMSATPGKIKERAPMHGEHTEEVLRAAGIEETTIQKIKHKPVDFSQFLK